MSDIDPIEYGKLVNSVENLERKVDAMEKKLDKIEQSLDTLIALAYQGVDTSYLVATLTAAIQEQQKLIENLTTRLNALEGK
jgi:predicted RNase H-like nuclease (RuvC/YqgF family)